MATFNNPTQTPLRLCVVTQTTTHKKKRYFEDITKIATIRLRCFPQNLVEITIAVS